MRASQTEQTASIGTSETKANFARIGWGPEDVHLHDLGTDLFVQVRDADLVDLGLVIGVQVKAGPTYFEEPVCDDAGSLTGWWFRESDRRHFDYWLSHSLPHVLALHDLDQRTSYWTTITDATVTSTGKGAKVFVPKHQRVDNGSFDALLTVARTGRTVSWEGTNWAIGSHLGRAARLRHALLVPRLIAPHPNASLTDPLDPPQAVALLSAGRIQELHQHVFAGRVLRPEQAASSPEWAWKFFAALYGWLMGEGTQTMRKLVESAPDVDSAAAAAIVAASALAEQSEPQAALDILDRTPVDDAATVSACWLGVQRARVLLEMGRRHDARLAAAAAQGARSLAPSDATASAIAGVAVLMIFSASDAGADLRSTLTAADTIANWWRAQTALEGAEAVVEDTFRSWAHDGTVTVGGEDLARNRLVSAMLTSSLTGSHNGWAGYQSLSAREQLRREARDGDPEHVAELVSELRHAGDAPAIELAGSHLARNGPAIALRIAAASVDLDRSTKTTAAADLKLLLVAGDVLPRDEANRQTTWLLDAYADPASFMDRTSTSRRVRTRFVETLTGLLGSVDRPVRQRAADTISALPPLDNAIEAQEWARVARALKPSDWTVDALAAIEISKDDQSDQLRWALEAVLAASSAPARSRLIELARDSGRLDAIGALGDVRALPDDVVASQIGSHAESVRNMIKDAKTGSYGLGVDVASNLVLLNAHHPSAAQWEPILELLIAPGMLPEQREGALLKIAQLADLVPEGVRQGLVDAGDQLADERIPEAEPMFPRPGSTRRAASMMVSALAGLDEPTAERVTALMAGNAQDRQTAARMAARWDAEDRLGVLVVLASDAAPLVRAEAAAALPGLVADSSSSALATAALRRASADPGTMTPLAVARALAGLPHPLREPYVSSLHDHASAQVRDAAAALDAVSGDGDDG